MKLETFFEKFDQFADAPDAVAKMRELVLQLAVQGKLVPFDADGEEQTVGDHIEFQNGYAFKSEWFKPSGMRLCRNLNVSHGNLDWRESAFVDDKVAKEFERFALGEGDIVLSLDRPLIATGLKVARVTQADLPCLLLQRVAKPVPKHDQLDLSYFMLWLNSSEFVDSIDPGRSNGVPHISTRQVQRLPFALPPLAEQKRIVAKVDELMALCDRLALQQQERGTRHAALARASLARFADAPTPANLPFLFHPSYAIPPRRPPQIHPHPRRPRQTRPPRPQRRTGGTIRSPSTAGEKGMFRRRDDACKRRGKAPAEATSERIRRVC